MTVPPELKPPQPCRHRDQTEPGRFGMLRRQAQDLRQSRRPCARRWTTSTRWRNGSPTQFDPALSWKDVEWIRSLWPGKLIIKGVLDVEDARLAAKTGASALVVSNHGGRQLDGAPSSISALPKIVDAVGGEIEIMFDGGIRSGQDVLRALALGARSCLIGRAYVYGLGAGGQAGVAQGDRFHPQRARRDHGALRREQCARDRPPSDRVGRDRLKV